MIFLEKPFAETDVILRRGGNINMSEIALYEFCCQEFEMLQRFYENLECNFVQHPDGFFFLVPTGSILTTRMLSRACINVGQILAMLARDPEITRTSGRIEVSQILKTIDTMVPREIQKAIYSPNTRESSTDRSIGDEVRKALRQLADLRFIRFVAGNEVIVLAESINRFAEVARYDNEIEEVKKIILQSTRGVTFTTPAITSTDSEDDNGEN